MAEFQITKTDDTEFRVHGWAYVAKDKDGKRVVDHSDEYIEPQDLEKAAYAFVEKSRESNDRHTKPVVGHLIESMVFTKEKMDLMGIPEGTLPEGLWVGFRYDPEHYAKIKAGKRQAWSIQGFARKVKE